MKKAFLLVLLGVAAYAPSLQGAFLLDDHSSIVNNPQVRRLWPVWETAAGSTRPLVQYSFAVNYAVGGLDPFGYHGVNLAIHLAAALLLMGLVARTLKSPGTAFAAAAFWLLHPLQTESVTYIAQRAESLMGLFYFATLYSFARGRRRASVFCCALGMLSKPAMATAPLAVLLYDRVFVSGSFRRALRRSPRYYAALACSGLVLVLLLLSPHESARSAGPWGEGVLSPLRYAANQCLVILHYLKLAVWPHPLCFDYLWSARPLRQLLLPIAVLVAGALALFWSARRYPRAGFLAGWFFLTLAATSSFIPVRDLAAEHRMYLPLAALAVAAALAGRRWIPGSRARVGAACILAALLGLGTYRRNQEYRSAETMWRSVLAQRPWNWRAHSNLGMALEDLQRVDEAIEQYREALRLKPDFAVAHNNLGFALEREKGNPDESWSHYLQAIESKADYAAPHLNAGNLLMEKGRPAEAFSYFEKALRLAPDSATVHNDVGAALMRLERLPEAREQFEIAIRLMPDFAAAHNNLGVVYGRLGLLSEAAAQYRLALRLEPDDPTARENLKAVIRAAGR